ncbi:3-hydroxyisobutyrate dehydrogenase, partial [Xanthomonas citri pv. citri]|nr:3-hydroxyisobutyrate dehydrogenase [Xanthomonas citri pv. citri]
MGGPMAANLAAAGHRVLGFDLVPEALEKARAAGVETVTDTAAAAAEADVVLTTLPHGRLVLDVYRGEDGDGGLLAAARPGTVFLDCSTIDGAG